MCKEGCEYGYRLGWHQLNAPYVWVVEGEGKQADDCRELLARSKPEYLKAFARRICIAQYEGVEFVHYNHQGREFDFHFCWDGFREL